jgi:outer membrane biosynthesis protein TonB
VNTQADCGRASISLCRECTLARLFLHICTSAVLLLDNQVLVPQHHMHDLIIALGKLPAHFQCLLFNSLQVTPTANIGSSSSPNSPNTAPPAAVEIPPIAPFTPPPSTPPNSPLPTPNVPHPPLLPTPPPPAIPPQLLPPHPGPPPQKLIPNAPSTQTAPTRPVTCSSTATAAGSSSGVCSSASGDAATQELSFEDVLASSGSSSSSGLLGLFRQQQGLQHRWQQVRT